MEISIYWIQQEAVIITIKNVIISKNVVVVVLVAVSLR